uniref:Pyruvate dehydrogenase E1 component subunit alpha type II n=1 Tax=Ascaris suum TaxID=6253 RepID=F1LAR1_ASCSU
MVWMCLLFERPLAGQRNGANAGKGPLMLEMSTYRYGGHSVADPGTSYRTREEVEEVRRTRDAINGFKEKIIPTGLLTEDELKEIDKKIRKEVDEAAKMARTGKEATTDLLLTDLYHNTPPQLLLLLDEFSPAPAASARIDGDPSSYIRELRRICQAVAQTPLHATAGLQGDQEKGAVEDIARSRRPLISD